ncbi:MAG: molybdenum cofactor guanylyltransferase MobA [Rhodobacteraceae bacterium]|nr:molybdenum cofactor guanylyltransferase MobA [Paracoccaceae bacterium]
MKVAGVILAGGQSSRMGGGDKSLLDLGGQTILTRVIARLAPQVERMALNANGNPERFVEYGLPVVADTIEGFAGPLAGVLAGMDWAHAQGSEYIVTVAADTPFFPDHLLVGLQMARESEDAPLAMAMTPDPVRKFARHPTFGLWSVGLRDDLRGALEGGVRKVVQWTEPHGCAKMVFNYDGGDPFFNVNTPEDVLAAQSMLKEFDA